MIPTVFSTRNVSDNMLDRMFDTYSNGQSQNRMPNVNIVEYADKMELEVAVPGLSKDDIAINLEDDVLTISAEKKTKEQSEHKSNYVKREFAYEEFKRAFNVGDELDQDKVEAHQENGILYITLPKKETAVQKGPRTINVQ